MLILKKLNRSFNVKKLRGVNEGIGNVFRCPSPYWYLANSQRKSYQQADGGDSPKMVIFFGNDMSGLLGFVGADKEKYISRANDCLDYVRQKFPGFDLCYKPHPGDVNEKDHLNLDGFRVVGQNTTAELVLLENLKKIRAVFTIASYSAFNGYSMGLDSHVFYHCFSDIYGRDFLLNLDDAFAEMPESFFVRSLSQGLADNSRELRNDESLKPVLKKILDENTGKIWMICSFSEYTVLLGILARIIKDLSPGRQIGFIASHHRRWDLIRGYLDTNFDEVAFMPRIHYSLKPVRLAKAIKVARETKRFKIALGDVLVVASQPDFVENCFVSYHKNNLKIGLTNYRDFYPQYDSRSSNYTAYSSYRFNKATWFFNRIFEPLLGLHRCLYLSFTSMKGFYFNRYQRPLNEIFDKLILFRVG